MAESETVLRKHAGKVVTPDLEAELDAVHKRAHAALEVESSYHCGTSGSLGADSQRAVSLRRRTLRQVERAAARRKPETVRLIFEELDRALRLFPARERDHAPAARPSNADQSQDGTGCADVERRRDDALRANWRDDPVILGLPTNRFCGPPSGVFLRLEILDGALGLLRLFGCFFHRRVFFLCSLVSSRWMLTAFLPIANGGTRRTAGRP